MRLKQNNMIVLILAFIFLLSGCDYIDLGGVFSSSDVDNRFDKNDSLKDYNAPTLADVNNYSFIVITDTHYYNAQLGYFEDIEKHKNNWGISFIVVTGDLIQNGKKEAYDLIKADIKKTSLPFYPVIGNHDIYNDGFKYYKKYFGRTMYDFTIGNTYYLFFDTANGTLGEQQKNWLKERLDKTNAKHKILFTHYSPTDQEFETPTSMTYPEEAYFLIDLCDKYNVDFFICGHLHKYDEKKIRGTKYIVLNNREKGVDCFLKVSVENGNLNYEVF
jgi:3',5'-cyclic AMP phosphodiesterase CpdA